MNVSFPAPLPQWPNSVDWIWQTIKRLPGNPLSTQQTHWMQWIYDITDWIIRLVEVIQPLHISYRYIINIYHYGFTWINKHEPLREESVLCDSMCSARTRLNVTECSVSIEVAHEYVNTLWISLRNNDIVVMVINAQRCALLHLVTTESQSVEENNASWWILFLHIIHHDEQSSQNLIIFFFYISF